MKTPRGWWAIVHIFWEIGDIVDVLEAWEANNA
jgi:hypothetical protein